MMRRRPFLKLTPYGLAILGVILQEPARASELPSYGDQVNGFAKVFNDWTALLSVSQPGIVDVREVRAWHAVLAAWDKLEKGTKYL